MDKIICLGKNYLDHIKEMGGDASEKPVLFLKPPSAVVFCERAGDTVRVEIPKGRGSVHPECEVVLRLDKNLKVEALTIGLDLTLRDVQATLKKSGSPWEISKAFPNSAVVGPWVELGDFKNFEECEFSFEVNGVLKQRSRPSAMCVKALDSVSYCRDFFKLCEGDLIFTGTPAGVGPVVAGDKSDLHFGSIQYSVLWK